MDGENPELYEEKEEVTFGATWTEDKPSISTTEQITGEEEEEEKKKRRGNYEEATLVRRENNDNLLEKPDSHACSFQHLSLKHMCCRARS